MSQPRHQPVNDDRANDPEIFLAGGGEMGAHMRAHDWSQTSLGEPATWPQALRTAVRVLLNTSHPMYIFWGQDGACLYNDAYSQSIGPERHPSSLGRPARAVWEEIWPIIGPQVEQVMAGGEATWFENALVPITRHGRREDVYWTYSFGPIDDLSAPRGVGGVLVVCSETTQAVHARARQAFQIELDDALRAIEQPREAMNAAAGTLGRFLGVDRCGYGEVDTTGSQLIVGGDWTAHDVPALSGRLRLEDFGPAVNEALARGRILRINDTRQDARTRRAIDAFTEAGDMQAAIVAPLVKNGRLVAVFYVHQSRPRAWSEDDEALVLQVAERTWAAVARARAEAAQQANERELRFALRAGRLGSWSLDAATGTLASSDIFRAHFGCHPESDLSYGDLLDGLHADDRPRLLGAIAEALETGAECNVDLRVFTADGGQRWIGIRGLPEHDGQGIARAIAGVSMDVTQAKASEARRLGLVRLTDVLTTIDDPDDLAYAAAEILGTTLDISRAGYGTIDPVRETITIVRDWNAPDIASLAGVLHFRDYGSYIEDLKRGETVLFADARSDSRTAGTAAALEAISARSVVNMPIREQNGLVALLYLNHAQARPWSEDELEFVRDVAQRTRMTIERRRAEQEVRAFTQSLEREVETRTADLRRSQARLRTIFETSFQYQGTVALDGTLLDANATSLEGIGASREEVLGQPFWDSPWFAETPGMPEIVRDAVSRVGRGETLRREICVNLQGRSRWFDFAMRPMRDENGEIIGIIPEAVEVTERHLAEEQLRQAQKLEAVGELTGGIAHDFNNLLQVIGGNLQLLSRDLAENPTAGARLESAMAGVARGAQLASQLLSFARRQPLAPKVVNLGGFVRGLEDMLYRSLGDGIDVETVVCDGLWNALVDPSQVENAILNLAINARDAMAGQGSVTITASNAVLTDYEIRGHDDVAPGQYVMLAVSDTGIGMPPEVIERAFEPFYTTKTEGHGTGLGLSMVWGLVKQSHGHIRIDSTVGKGTTVRLYLPRSMEEAQVISVADQQEVEGGNETILLVEDHEFVRATEIELLEELGYRVIAAADAQSALDLIEGGARPDLLFTDVVMPGPLRSPELARRAREIMPGLPVLYASGYSQEQIMHDGRLNEGIELLSKPFKQSDLARKLRQLLDGDGRAGDRSAATAQSGAESGGLNVLLVEDDPLIRMATADMLTDMGHHVVEAGCGPDALSLLERHAIDILLTDIGLPGMSGEELAGRVRRGHPELPVVFVSGRDSLGRRESAVDGPAIILLTKPFDERTLKQVLAQAAGAGRAGP